MLIWLLGMWGFVWLARRKGKLPCALIPLAVMSAVTLCAYAFALARVLRPGCALLMALGAALGVWGAVDVCRRRAWMNFVPLVPFCAACALLLWRYHGALLVAYDDFSHWGMMARHLLTTHALPGAEDSLITFQSYVPGAALWIYTVGLFLGPSEGVMLGAQAWLTLAGLWAVGALVRPPRRAVGWTAVAVLCVVGLSLLQGTASLMVDNLVAALAIGAMALVLRFRDCPGRAAVPLAFTLTLLTLVKDAGLLFAAMVWLAAAGLQVRGARSARALLVPLGGIAAARLAWQVHIRLAFPAAGLTRHALSVENLRRMGADKSLADLAQLARALLSRALSPDNQALQALGLLAAALLLPMLWRGLRARRVTAVLWAGVGYAVYLFFLWGMYAFTLNLASAQKLVAFERYNSTYALFLYGVLAAVCLTDAAWRRREAALVLVLLPLALPIWRAGLPRLARETYFVPLRAQMERLARERPLAPSEKAGIVLQTGDDPTFAWYMARYTFQSDALEVCASPSELPDADVWYTFTPKDAFARPGL